MHHMYMLLCDVLVCLDVPRTGELQLCLDEALSSRSLPNYLTRPRPLCALPNAVLRYGLHDDPVILRGV